MKKIIYMPFFLAIGFASCKKTYVCQCTNVNTTYIAGEKDGTKNQAKKYCQSLSTNDTSCDIK